MKEYEDFKAKISNDDRTKNYKYFRELDVSKIGYNRSYCNFYDQKEFFFSLLSLSFSF